LVSYCLASPSELPPEPSSERLVNSDYVNLKKGRPSVSQIPIQGLPGDDLF